MANLKSRAQKAVRSLGRRGRTTRIPDDVRAAILAYAGAERERGMKWREIADTVGLSESVLVRWSRGERRSRGRGPGRLLPVRVAVAPRAVGVIGGVTLVSPSGYRIEGLAATDAVDALRTFS
jgi:hypothetical protein